MSRRRLAFTAIVAGLALTLAAAPVQARESPFPGWLGTLTHQLAQWTAGWWAWPTQGAPAGKARHLGKNRPIRVECGIQVDPNGGCESAISPH